MTKLKKAGKIRDHILDAEICQTKASVFSDFDKILTPKERMLSTKTSPSQSYPTTSFQNCSAAR